MINKEPPSVIPEKTPPLFKIEPALISLMVVAFLAGVAFGYSLPKTRDIGLVGLPMSEEATEEGAKPNQPAEQEEKIWQK